MNGGEGKAVPHKAAKEFLGISDTTLRRWAKQGRINFFLTPAGHRRYDLSPFLHSTEKKNGAKICYCRVSTKKQSHDLDNQVAFCKKQFPNHEVVADIGSSLNWKRKGLTSLLDRAFNGELSEIVVTYRDRLTRFGFPLIEKVFEKCGVKLMVLNETVHSGPEELAEDILQIITVFSARYYGSRKYHTNSEDPAETNTPPEDFL